MVANTIGLQEPEKLLLSIPEAAKALDASPRFVWQLVYQRILPHVRKGRRVSISVAALHEYIQKNTVPARDAKTVARDLLNQSRRKS